MRAELRLRWMKTDRIAIDRDAAVEAFLNRRGWPKDPLPQPHPYTIEDREDVEQELRLAHWTGARFDVVWRLWKEDADRLARTYVGYGQGGVWNAT